MPKIIENLKDRLAGEACRQVQTSGYGAMTIRSVATACGVGTGTVYNYYPSKDAMLATGMAGAWSRRMERITEKTTSEALLRAMYDELRAFAEEYGPLFRDPSAAAHYGGAFSRYHAVLRTQLAEPLFGFCPDRFTAEFIAEAMLTWTMAGKEFDQIFSLIRRLYEKEI